MDIGLTPLARARIRAHKYFDLIWQTDIMTRGQAYKNLKIWMNHKGSTHIRWFSIRQCNKLVKTLKKLYPDLYKDNIALEDDLFYP